MLFEKLDENILIFDPFLSRTATITSKSDIVVWCLERSCFQTVVKSAGQEKDQERYELVKNVKDLKVNKLKLITDLY